MDGTYDTNNLGFSLYHLLGVDNNGENQPLTQFFTKTETKEAIVEFLRIFTENNDASITKVTITDKDCSEIAALEEYFPEATHILCHFHVLKAVDARLNKKVDGKGLTEQCKDKIREHFRKALYAETDAAFEHDKQHLLNQGKGEESLSSYFQLNWFNIAPKWTTLGRRHLPTFGNNTTNRLERFHHIIKEIFLKTKRLDLVIRHLLDNIKLRMTERKLKQKIRELRFPHKNTKTNPLFQDYQRKISPFAWSLVAEKIGIVTKKKISYSYIQKDEVYDIKSRNYNYRTRTDLTKCTCQFFSNYGLPCRHIIFFLIKDKKEIEAN
ncbi:uncharacterized protein LOC116919332 [Daphnia magna]|uniref:uncharacterized protein LOC116919332 n=1 Tax=Daphnia magna TaxID=35525 RepID=UPI001E1BB939|nr:uncharacterized protein LOC116919332 [Daphnia magna]